MLFLCLVCGGLADARLLTPRWLAPQVIAKEAGLVEEAAAAGAKGQGGELETDAGIGRTKMAGLVGRELVAWAPEAGETGDTANGAAAPAGVSLNLEEVGGGHAGRGSRGEWVVELTLDGCCSCLSAARQTQGLPSQMWVDF